MTGVVNAALITGAVAAAGTGASLYSSAASRAQQGQALGQGQDNLRNQMYLQYLNSQRQYDLSTATQTDAYGNKLIYDPTTNSWVAVTSPQGQALVNRSDAITRNNDIRNLTTGQDERTLALNRRVGAGEGADALLRQFTNQYGAPTKEGVGGTARVAAATAATEPADIAKSGFTAAALRQNASIPNLNQTLSSADRAQTAGLRTALATDTNPLFQEMKANYTSNLLNPRSQLASESSAPDIPFAPSTIPTTLDSASLNRSMRAPGTATNPYAGYTLNASSKALMDSMGSFANNQLPIGSAFTTLGNAAKDIYNAYRGVPGGFGTPSYSNPGDAYWSRVRSSVGNDSVI